MTVRHLALCLLFLAESLRGGAETLEDYAPPPAGQVRIIRDTYGVPHVIARENRALLYGVGYVQAEDQIENLAKNFLRGQGRSAEQEGVAQLIFDHLVRLLEIPERSRQGVEQIDTDSRQEMQAFCDGVNAYLVEHRDDVPKWIEPVQPAHLLGFAQFVDLMFCVRDCRDDLERAGIKLASLDTLPHERQELWGSNQFALKPQRSDTGAALLSMDPHLPHNSFFRWYEMHTVGPEINVLGACFFGSPYVSMGRTDRSAWCMTVNAPDLGDVFTFEVNPADPTQYQDLDGWKPFRTSTEEYRVATPVGVTTSKLSCKRTTLGPVVAEKDGVAYVFALPLPEIGGRVRQLYQMARARNAQQFREALAPLGLSMFNIVYADTDGDILYISNGRVPRRDLRIDSHDVRPGDADWARWQGFHKLEELPQTLNPPAGYLLNANSGPQNVTPEGAPDLSKFPPYMNSQQANSRSRRLSELLSADTTVTWEELATYATDTQLEAAVKYLPQIIASLQSEAARRGGTEGETLKSILTVLEAWNRRTDLDSRGAVLFWHLATHDDFLQALDQGSPSGDSALATAALAVAEAVQKRFQTLDVPWSEFSRVRRGKIETGVAGCGIPRSNRKKELIGAALRPTSGPIRGGRQWCEGGSSYGMLVDFSGRTRAISCLPYGVSEHPDSPHFADQLPLYAAGQFKPAWFWPDEIRANTESDRTLLVPTANP